MNEFWKTKRLEDFTPQEWESLCDGCSQCCLYKLQEDVDGDVRFTNVVCRYMDMDTCVCTDYIHRHENVPDCIYLTLKLAREVNWLPKTCAYNLVAHGQDLPWWHPLKTGDPASTKRAGASVYGKVVGETEVDPEDLEDMVVDWFK
jgi:uncharacterized cysteine cluster protein YcgN (CxxCxxCC family)